MQLFLQQIVEGLASGAVYASLALALVLIYRATRVVNFAQGEMATLSAYFAWQLNRSGVPFWLSLVIVAVVSFVMGALVFRLIMRRVLGAWELLFLAPYLWILASRERLLARVMADHYVYGRAGYAERRVGDVEVLGRGAWERRGWL